MAQSFSPIQKSKQELIKERSFSYFQSVDNLLQVIKSLIISLKPKQYYQGMSSFAAIFMLFGLENHEVLFYLSFVFNKMKMMKLYLNDFTLTLKLVALTKEIIQEKMPDLIQEETETKLDMVLLNWFLTFFVNVLSLKEVIVFCLKLVYDSELFLC